MVSKTQLSGFALQGLAVADLADEDTVVDAMHAAIARWLLANLADALYRGVDSRSLPWEECPELRVTLPAHLLGWVFLWTPPDSGAAEWCPVEFCRDALDDALGDGGWAAITAPLRAAWPDWDHKWSAVELDGGELVITFEHTDCRGEVAADHRHDYAFENLNRWTA